MKKAKFEGSPQCWDFFSGFTVAVWLWHMCVRSCIYLVITVTRGRSNNRNLHSVLNFRTCQAKVSFLQGQLLKFDSFKEMMDEMCQNINRIVYIIENRLACKRCRLNCAASVTCKWNMNCVSEHSLHFDCWFACLSENYQTPVHCNEIKSKSSFEIFSLVRLWKIPDTTIRWQCRSSFNQTDMENKCTFTVSSRKYQDIYHRYCVYLYGFFYSTLQHPNHWRI